MCIFCINLLNQATFVNSNTMMSESQLADGELCTICQDNEEEHGGSTYRLTCQHIFHKSCLAHWLQVKSNCPNCRCPVPIQIALSLIMYLSKVDLDTLMFEFYGEAMQLLHPST